MSTYVSQLMRQTGIALSSETSWQGGEELADIFSGESSAEEFPLQEEHQEVLVPQPTQPAPVIVQPLQDAVVNAQTMPETPIGEQRRAQETVSQGTEIEDSLALPTQERGKQNIPTEPESTPSTVPQITPESIIVEQFEIQSSTTNMSSAVPTQKEARRNLEPSREIKAPVTSPLERVETIQMEQTRTESSTDSTPTPQTYLQVVRDWVAGSPVVLEEVREVFVEQPPQPTSPFRQEDATKPIIVKNQQPSSLGLEQISHSETQEPNVQQDFVLSIGSIHLTLAAPPPQSNPPLIVTPQPAPALAPEPFRLSRHYLRFR